ncbi:uncharacterized protein Z518_05029 [Rhinocladiella mackenziei CBS 650.93]|uniref:Clr5 domain-containing protein n=1 Tax=Rhinocladiella mackenziei CBS 650.93 TaxID=1442369 RepID=A0A0D2FXN8_9EURO|nr:uncharacterized protein Z518_05029 [Rhinocladiella mackenziei CBS 650.93]KIX07052.1 hypothetical protein Z518_05029 [Rhinocladiella mackenziei CBS 650.93]
MEPETTYVRPHSEADWDKWRPLFTRLYIEENRTLPQVMEIMRDEHRVWASQKMYKNKIKAWNLRKYLKEDEAQQILEGEIPETGAIATAGDPEEVKKRAARSIQRKRARQRARIQIPSPDQPSPMALALSPSPLTPTTPSSPMEPSGALVPSMTLGEAVTTPQLDHFRVTGVTITEQFLRNLRRWTHDAYVFGHWDMQQSAKHHSGRRASRLLSSSLTAGINLFENKKEELAWTHWNRAFASFQSSDLFKTWYHEIPMSLLFEVGRVAHSGHDQLAALLLKSIRNWAHTFLDENDSRHALLSSFGELQVAQLRDLYHRAARCLYDGLESRVDKHSQLLYEVRLNRALDMLWYDPQTDLTNWLPPIEEVDQACGPNNSYAVYFLLLEAYRLVAKELYTDADQVCSQVRNRLTAMQGVQGSIDPWRVGLAYRRLGRQQHSKGRFTDARRSFNTALKYVSGDSQLSMSVLIEICQRQESMANAVHDQEDVFFWSQMLSRLEQQAKDQGEADILKRPQTFSDGTADGAGAGALIVSKKRRLSPGPTRRSTF